MTYASRYGCGTQRETETASEMEEAALATDVEEKPTELDDEEENMLAAEVCSSVFCLGKRLSAVVCVCHVPCCQSLQLTLRYPCGIFFPCLCPCR